MRQRRRDAFKIFQKPKQVHEGSKIAILDGLRCRQRSTVVLGVERQEPVEEPSRPDLPKTQVTLG